jgi:putative ABC transport system ATP-binding protein
MIVIDDISITLNGLTILSHLSLRVHAGEKAVISGESGSGKSTLLRTLIGRHRPETGTLSIAGTRLVPENLRTIRSRIFYLPQEIVPLGDETVRDFLALPYTLAVNRGARFSKEKAEALFDTLRLKPHLMTSPLATLSGGERKRVGLVQAMLLGRPILLLDELTSSVDEDNREKLVDTVLGLKETTVSAVAHDAYFMARATRRLVLSNGHIEEQTHGRQ